MIDQVIPAFILGVVEGITEFLPVSSTGHLLIAESLLDYHQSDAFNVLIQVGPIFAVTLVFWKHIVGLITGLGDEKKRDEVLKLLASFGLTVLGGLIAKVLGLKLPETVLPVAIATVVGGLAIFWIEKRAQHMVLSDTVTWQVAIAIAAGQLLAAVFPGTSRSGAAVMVALLLGASRPSAVRFAFLVGIPTMFAAGALQIKEVVASGQGASLLGAETICAFVAATITAWFSVIWLIKFVQTRNFVPFAWYRLGLGAAMFGLMAMGIIT